jgi:formamidopyrimidine-DNA glycosylase
MPELPEVERARTVIDQQALGRRIVAVGDVDEYVCRPHHAEQFQHALVGLQFTAARRRGKTMWVETSANSHSPVLGLHLGMGGRIVVTDASGAVVPDGDSNHNPAGEHHRTTWDRFTAHFDDGRALRLADKIRLSRAILDPDMSGLGADALVVGPKEFRAALGSSRVAIKARLMDQSVIAGVGNLLCDEILWRARIDPRRRVVDLTSAEITTLHRTMRATLRYVMRRGGSHTGHVVPFRYADARCPRCDAPMNYGRVGGRSTWWCSAEQR